MEFDEFSIPRHWTRAGLVLPRQAAAQGGSVSGDPCVVWDEEINGWRMVFFHDPPGHGEAVCLELDAASPGSWKLQGPISVANPEAVAGGTADSFYIHKPFLVMDPHRMNQAAKIDGRYCLLVVSQRGPSKLVQRAWSERLAGPWTFEPGPLIAPGAAEAFDEKHVDAVTGYYFPEREEFIYFYMGYPRSAQPRGISPYGSAQAVATQKLNDAQATKRGVILEPCQEAGHWASGWVGGLQIMPGREHRWIALINASPTAPGPVNTEIWSEEPPPSLGGFGYCDEEWPTQGWHFFPEPIEWIEDIPAEALANGEGVNLWRHFLHVLPDGRAAVFYNSGSYGREQLYLKIGE